MRRSTAAGINNSLLPRDCSCDEFAGGAILEEASFSWHLWISGSAIQEEPSFPGICG